MVKTEMILFVEFLFAFFECWEKALVRMKCNNAVSYVHISTKTIKAVKCKFISTLHLKYDSKIS